MAILTNSLHFEILYNQAKNIYFTRNCYFTMLIGKYSILYKGKLPYKRIFPSLKLVLSISENGTILADKCSIVPPPSLEQYELHLASLVHLCQSYVITSVFTVVHLLHTGQRGLSVARLEEAKKRSSLYTGLHNLEGKTRRKIQTLQKRYQDMVTYQVNINLIGIPF